MLMILGYLTRNRNRDRLTAQPSNGHRIAGVEAAFFDLDKTVIARASLVAFGRPLYREGLISRTTLVRGLYVQLVYLHLGASERRLAGIKKSVLNLTKGWNQIQVDQIVREGLEAIMGPIVYREAQELIEHHRAAGRRVVIISATPEGVVAPLGHYLGVHEVIATRPKVDADGRYTGELDFHAYGPYKAQAIRSLADREGIDLPASFAYSDSCTDLPMLETVGHPVAVNPDRQLLRVARQRGWEVRYFARPVRVRSATSHHPAAVAGVAAGLAGAGALRWRLRLGRAALGRPGLNRSAASWRRRPPRSPGRPATAASSWRPRLMH